MPKEDYISYRMNKEIVKIIRSYQESLGLTDIKFIGTEGGDASEWSHIKSGRRELSGNWLRRLGNKYPALQPAIKDYLFPPASRPSLLQRIFGRH